MQPNRTATDYPAESVFPNSLRELAPTFLCSPDEPIEIIEAHAGGPLIEGPGLLLEAGVPWSLPNHEVAYPFHFRISPMVPFSIGIIES